MTLNQHTSELYHDAHSKLSNTLQGINIHDRINLKLKERHGINALLIWSRFYINRSIK